MDDPWIWTDTWNDDVSVTRRVDASRSTVTGCAKNTGRRLALG